MAILTNISTGIWTVILLVFRERKTRRLNPKLTDGSLIFQMNQLMNFTDVKMKVYKAEGKKKINILFSSFQYPRLQIKILLPQPPEYKVIGPLKPYLAP